MDSHPHSPPHPAKGQLFRNHLHVLTSPCYSIYCYAFTWLHVTDRRKHVTPTWRASARIMKATHVVHLLTRVVYYRYRVCLNRQYGIYQIYTIYWKYLTNLTTKRSTDMYRNERRREYVSLIWKMFENISDKILFPGSIEHNILCKYDDVIKWKHFPHYWPFVQGIHRSPVNSSHKSRWRGALMFSLICAWINGWVNNREAGDLRHQRAHYDDIMMRDTGGLKLMRTCSHKLIFWQNHSSALYIKLSRLHCFSV